MSKEEKEIEELNDKFRKLTPGNRLNYLSNLRVMLATQESTLKEAKRPASPVAEKTSRQSKRRVTAQDGK